MKKYQTNNNISTATDENVMYKCFTLKYITTRIKAIRCKLLQYGETN